MEYRFVIEKFTPENLPLDLFYEAIASLKNALENPKNVHFKAITHGSASIVIKVEEEFEPNVLKSIDKFKNNPKNIDSVNKFLKKFNTYGYIGRVTKTNAGNDNIQKVIEFKGAKVHSNGFVGAVNDEAEIDGYIIGNTGKDDTKHIRILKEDDSVINAECTTSVAKDLLQYQYEHQLIRFKCLVKFYRDNEGKWSAKDYKILHHTPLEDKSLYDTIKDVKSKERLDWYKEKNPYKELEDERSE